MRRKKKNMTAAVPERRFCAYESQSRGYWVDDGSEELASSWAAGPEKCEPENAVQKGKTGCAC